MILAAITGRVTPQALPRAAFDGTKTYGTFCGQEMETFGNIKHVCAIERGPSGWFGMRTLSSASRGRWSRISIGSVSAAMMTTSLIPLLSVFVAAKTNSNIRAVH